MVESLTGRGPAQETIRNRPRRIANKFARCAYLADVAIFYADELGVPPSTFWRESLEKLTPEVRTSLVRTTTKRFAQLIRDGVIYPEALTRSCTKVPPIGKYNHRTDEPVSVQEEFQLMEEPFFSITLNRYIPRSSFKFEDLPAVLSLACGEDTEARAIHGYFNPDSATSGVHVGIDRNGSSIEDARWLYRNNPNCHFIAGDLDSEQVRRQTEAVHPNFDMVVMRHFPVLPEGELWQRTLDGYAKFLRPGGLLMMTLYYPQEFEIVQEQGFPESYQVEVSERNKARSFNKRLFNQAMMHGAFGAMGVAFSDEPPQEQFTDVVENVFRQDQFIVLATKK